MTTKPARSRTPKKEPRPDKSGESSRDLARYATLLATSPLVRGGAAAEPYARPMFGDDVLFNEYVAELRKQTDAIVAGDLSGVESMLATQANTLDLIFNQLARKAANCEYLNQFQVHLSLALKAQAQSRATLEALAEIKNPRPVAFVKQANIANGPQQVNNAAHGNAPPDARAREKWRDDERTIGIERWGTDGRRSGGRNRPKR
jgi:hypothetical protein